MRYVFLTDAAPLQEGGAGCQILARNWLDAMSEHTCLVVARRTLFGSDRAQLRADQTIPVRYFFDLHSLRLGRLPLLRRCLEWLLFLCMLPSLAKAVRNSGAQRIFALSVAAPGFLFFASTFAWITGLPLDFYLVDDYEEFVRQSSQAYLAPVVRFLEPRYLRRADRVFAISPGFVEHLWNKYGQKADWLPVLAQENSADWHPFHPSSPDERCLVFVGSVNFLYEEGLVDLYREIEEWNRQPSEYHLRLKLLTRQRPESLLKLLPSTEFLDLVIDANDAEKAQHLHNAWAIFLPYAFNEKLRIFVTTSFSYKFTDAIAAGRPILVYGPPYASIPRYFREQDLPLSAGSRSELASALSQLEGCDQAQTISRYAETLRRHYSPEALRRVLAAPGAN